MTKKNVSRETIAKNAEVKVALIAGGATHERDISMRSAHSVAKALKAGGFKTEVLEPNHDLIPKLNELAPNLLWPMVHGGFGEDGSLQDLLELLGLPYVGARANGARLASEKPVAKTLLQREGVATPKSVTLPRKVFMQVGSEPVMAAIAQTFDFPLVVKPADGGSSLGVTCAQDANELRTALVDAFAYGETALIESFVAGREIAVSLVDFGQGVHALAPVEVETEGGPYDFQARYESGRSVFYAPARLSEAETKAVQETAVKCFEILGLRDYGRIDLLLAEDGTPWFIDANVIPGMTDMSLFPQAAEAGGDFIDVIQGIALAALARYESWKHPELATDE
ncbi:hypothetical protein BK816_08960 [Boudabousia tangfeifanii]|uniref:D-alanine--D-alanine ligase n=1 Tax=Boudabousia tangfeifanii TaxID=1912795 RepID=A0A1D9MMJ6_9ACTO|nr:D-alanine--D-alanine ligase [Boudabousia tangfeifanii]AOZ73383.1 hypothetical protein BK816_08960 [Boudabousia tangfeifanii]